MRASERRSNHRERGESILSTVVADAADAAALLKRFRAATREKERKRERLHKPPVLEL